MSRIPRVAFPIVSLAVVVLAWQPNAIDRSASSIAMLTVTADPDVVEEPENKGSANASYIVQNTGTTTILNINMACTASGPVACVSVNPSFQSSLAPGAAREVNITYATGAAGAAGVILTATGNTGAPASTPWP